jgi:hypothetical protein
MKTDTTTLAMKRYNLLYSARIDKYLSIYIMIQYPMAKLQADAEEILTVLSSAQTA